MSPYGLFKGDLLIIDRSLKVREGNFVLLHYQGEQVKGFKENAEDLGIIRVIKTVIHRFKVWFYDYISLNIFLKQHSQVILQRCTNSK